ncbi:MAG: NfeD family protein [Desulfopila sp.]
MDSLFSTWLIWFVMGIALALAELMLPGFVILFFAVGCLAVAGALLIWPLTAAQQFLLFAGVTLVSIVLLRKWCINVFQGASSNRAETNYDDFPRGAQATVVKPITTKTPGRIAFRGTLWDAAAEEYIEEGEMVEIVRFAGDATQTFFVKKL